MATRVVVGSPTEAQLRTEIETNAVDGDTVQLTPPVAVTLTTNPLRVIDKAIRILGTGRDCTITGMAGQHIFQCTNSGFGGGNLNRLQFEGMRLVGNATGLDAINITGTAAKGAYSHTEFRRLDITNCRNGINVQMPNLTGDTAVHLEIEGCDITVCRTNGVNLSNVTMATLMKNEINNCQNRGVLAINAPSIWIGGGTAVETCNLSNEAPGSTLEGGGQLLLKLCHQFYIAGLDIENLPSLVTAGRAGLILSNCNGGTVASMRIASALPGVPDETYGVRAVVGSKGIRVLSLSHSNIEHPLAWSRTCEPISYDEADIVQEQPSVLTVSGMPTEQ